MPGDYRDVIQRTYGSKVVDLDLPTGNNILVAAKGPLQLIAVQYVSFVPSTFVAATITLVDSITGLAVGTLTVPASAPQIGDGSSMLFLNYGPSGTKLSKGANLLLGVTANGAAGRLHIEYYQKPNIYTTH
jgi:hypothetical protein